MALKYRDRHTRKSSIVLIGPHGAGKSSLATIASGSLGLKPVDIEEIFRHRHGVPLATYVKQNEDDECTSADLEVIRQVFEQNVEKSVIIWPSGCVGKRAYAVLEEFSQAHSIIFVARDARGIQRYLKHPDLNTVKRVVELENRIYRASSHYEFFNLDEEDISGSSATDNNLRTATSPNPLRLKRLEGSFVRFLRNILPSTRQPTQKSMVMAIPQSRYPRSYVLDLPLSRICSSNFDIRSLDCGADACQLKIDICELSGHTLLNMTNQISVAHAIVSRFFDGPIIYHLHCPSTVTQYEALYVELLRHGTRIGVDYITLELKLGLNTISSLLPYRHPLRVIGVYHDPEPGPNGWSTATRWNIFEQAASIPGLEAIRLTQVAKSMEDNSAVIAFKVSASRSGSQLPLIAYNTGPLGRWSRCENEILTPVTVADLDQSGGDNLSIKSIQNALYSSFIYERRNFYLLNEVMSNCRVPRVLRAAFEFFGLQHTTHIGSIECFHDLLNDAFMGGISLFNPGYKMSCLSSVSSLSEHAKNIGAINIAIPIRSQLFEGVTSPPPDFWKRRNMPNRVVGLYGDNTDWLSISECIRRNLSPANAITKNTAALVIGAGTMAHAALYSLLQMGVRNVVIYNRTFSNAAALASRFHKLQPTRRTSESALDLNIRVLDSLQVDWDSDMAQPTIVVSCVPTSEDESFKANFVLPLQWMKSTTGGVVLDLNYRPVLTPLLHQVHEHATRGWVAVDGLENLAARTAIDFELFTGRKAPRTLIKAEVLKV